METVLEYRVIPVTRYIVTKYESGMSENSDGTTGRSVETIGEFQSEKLAYEVATKCCRDDHQNLGFPVGDERVKYPKRVENVAKASK